MTEFIISIFKIPMVHAQAARTAVEGVASETEGQITGIVTFVVSQIPLWITAVIVIILSFVLARIVKSAVENKMTSEGLEEEHREIQIVAGRTANAAVLIIGITVGLKIAGLDLTAIIAAGAFGIGFALQDLIMNFIAGVMVLSARHYSIGDAIKVNGTMGRIVDIQTRATILKAFDGTKIVVPNAELFKSQVTSFTSNPFRRIQIVNGVAYGSDLKHAMNVVMEAVKATPGVLVEPKPSIWFYEWGDYSINFKINAWVDSRGGWVKIRTQLIFNVDKALDDNNINIPYPIQTIYMGKEEEEEKKLEKLVMEDNKKIAPLIKPMEPSSGIAPEMNPEVMSAPAWLKKTSEEVMSAPVLQPSPVAVNDQPVPSITQAAEPQTQTAVAAAQEPALSLPTQGQPDQYTQESAPQPTAVQAPTQQS